MLLNERIPGVDHRLSGDSAADRSEQSSRRGFAGGHRAKVGNRSLHDDDLLPGELGTLAVSELERLDRDASGERGNDNEKHNVAAAHQSASCPAPQWRWRVTSW